jgi:hypothetical protein
MILSRQIVETSDVACGYDEEMDGSVRMDILNYHKVFVSIYKTGGLFPADNLTKDAILHI